MALNYIICEANSDLQNEKLHDQEIIHAVTAV